MNVKLWYSKSMKKWRWDLVDEKLDGVEIDFDIFVGKNKNVYTQLLINNLRKNKIEINLSPKLKPPSKTFQNA